MNVIDLLFSFIDAEAALVEFDMMFGLIGFDILLEWPLVISFWIVFLLEQSTL